MQLNKIKNHTFSYYAEDSALESSLEPV